VLNRETRALRRELERAAGSMPQFAEAAASFYAAHVKFVARRARHPGERAEAYCLAQCDAITAAVAGNTVPQLLSVWEASAEALQVRRAAGAEPDNVKGVAMNDNQQEPPPEHRRKGAAAEAYGAAQCSLWCVDNQGRIGMIGEMVHGGDVRFGRSSGREPGAEPSLETGGRVQEDLRIAQAPTSCPSISASPSSSQGLRATWIDRRYNSRPRAGIDGRSTVNNTRKGADHEELREPAVPDVPVGRSRKPSGKRSVRNA
jgi:hypothetical protein